MPASLKTNVYVDGFNLYYGKMKNSPYKWLNIRCLCETIFPKNNICSIKYFTARVRGTPKDPDQPIRQAVYFRALKTINDLTLIYGHFLTNPKTMPISGTNPIKWVTVDKTEEKGSDVNLATHLLLDAFNNEYDAAILITNDSDLAEPVRVVRDQFKKTVLLLNPFHRYSAKLAQYSDFKKRIMAHHLAGCQFPPKLSDAGGEFYKPPEWNKAPHNKPK